MTQIKILHPITSLDRDGAQQMLYRLIKSLPAERYQHVIVSLRERMPFADEFEAIGVRVICLGMAPSRPSLAALFGLRKIIREVKPDIIQSWLYHANFYSALATRFGLSSIPLIWGVRGSLDSGWARGMVTGMVIAATALLSRFPTIITFNSKASIDQHRLRGYRNKNMCYLPNGFDVSRFGANEQVRANIRQRLQLSPEVTLIGLAGRYDRSKDYPTFVRAFHQVLMTKPNTHGLIVGRGVDAPDSPLRALVEELNLQDAITLWGAQSDLAQCLPAYDVFCSSSVTEGFPNVVAEALACEVPCVVTNVGMGSELVADLGVAVPPSNPEALAKGLLEILKLDQNQRSLIGKKGRERICQQFDLATVAGKFENVYETALQYSRERERSV